MYVVGICGAPGAGKDTAAHIIADTLREEGYTVEVDSFAAPLRAAAQRLLGDDCLDRDQKEVPRVVRFDNEVEDVYTAVQNALAPMLGGTDAGVEADAECVALKLLALMDEHGCLRLQNYGVSLKVTPRQVMQWLGTECGRDMFGNDFWVNKLYYRHEDKGTEVVILPDVRFMNEVVGVDYLIGVTGRGAPLSEHRSDALTAQLVGTARARVDNSGPIERLRFDLQRFLITAIMHDIQHEE